jgi:F-type H+-transporting ATPase subunit a
MRTGRCSGGRRHNDVHETIQIERHGRKPASSLRTSRVDPDFARRIRYFHQQGRGHDVGGRLPGGVVHGGRRIGAQTMGKEGMRFFPLIATLFLFILFCNIIGLIPGSYTVTSQIIVTAVFSCVVYGISLVMGFLIHGIKFLGILVPPGTPGWLLPLMIPIELMSQLARPISLAVRLFANMTAGHVILGVLFGMAISGGLLIGWLPFAFTVAIYGLEVGIAFIQAYIFTILTCVYIGDAYHLHGHDEHAH